MDSKFELQGQHEWQKSLKQRTDIISIQNILVTVNAGTDAWSRPKQQPALISVNLSLTHPFSSAITGDDLDTSTINYGTLSKNIVSATARNPTTWLSHPDLVLVVETAARDTSPREDMLYTSEVDVFFPKATLLGEGVGIRLSKAYGLKTYSRVLHLKNLNVATIVGVNAHERLLKQTVIANVWIDRVTGKLSMAAHNKLEQHVIAVNIPVCASLSFKG